MYSHITCSKLNIDISSDCPIKGKTSIATALNIKIIDSEINNSFGFDLIIGAIAAIAVAPQMAVPEDIQTQRVINVKYFG